MAAGLAPFGMTARTHHCRGCTRAAGQTTATRQVFTHPNYRELERDDWLLRAAAEAWGLGFTMLAVIAATMVREVTEHWRCTVCGDTLLTMSDVPDSIGLCMTAARQCERKINRDLGDDWRAEATQELSWAIQKLHRLWKPWKQRSFLAFASTMLRNRLIDWERANKGRDTPKPLAVAASLDAPLGSGESELTLMDSLPSNGDGLAAIDSVINVRALSPRSRLFHEHVAKPAVEQDLTLEQSAERIGWSRAQLLRSRSVYYAEVRAQVAA